MSLFLFLAVVLLLGALLPVRKLEDAKTCEHVWENLSVHMKERPTKCYKCGTLKEEYDENKMNAYKVKIDNRGNTITVQATS
jgi:hypothetical protein